MPNNKARSVKNFVVDHKVSLLSGALFIVTTVAIIQRSGIKNHNEFLKAKGLLEEYYALFED